MCKRTILIIDDEPNISRASSRLFKAEGWEVLIASSFSQALPLMPHADIILSDYHMGADGSGEDVIIAAGDTPVVIFTSDPSGVAHSHVMGKPAPFDALLDAVNRAASSCGEREN
jgi:DNA-binding NtrC family response regulator